MKATIIKYKGKYRVKIIQDNQSFYLNEPCTIKEAEVLKAQFEFALHQHNIRILGEAALKKAFPPPNFEI